MLFGLSDKDIADLDVKVEYGDESASVTSNTGVLFEVINQLPSSDHRDPLLYDFAFCVTGFHGEAQVASIRTQGEHISLGYILPMTSFRGGEGFPSEWSRRFAHVAFRKLVTLKNMDRFGKGVSLDHLRGGQHFPDEIFPDDLSILVIGKSNFRTAGIDIALIKLMLLAQKVTVISEPMVGRNFVVTDYSPNVNVRMIAKIVADDADVIFDIMSGADGDWSEFGRFLRLYQIMEFCIEAIYGWGMSALIDMNLASWKLKKKLSEITADRYRLAALDAHCLEAGVERQFFRELSTACRAFLVQMGDEGKAEEGWPNLLYGVRNIVVHDQMKMMRVSGVQLTPINEALREVCLELTGSFRKPDFKEIWKDMQAAASVATAENNAGVVPE